jgi:aryl-alcohol dehydrogenase-like predicted oxidoreductase
MGGTSKCLVFEYLSRGGNIMEYRNIAGSALKVSEIGLGGDTFNHPVDSRATAEIVNQAIDSGINFIDTSDVYGWGKSEEYIGLALKGRRSQVYIATKFGIANGEGDQMFWEKPGLGKREYIFKEVEVSLRRLCTDYIDLYQFHFPDPTTPIEETLRALDDLVHAGKVRYIGCSNFSSWQLCEAIWTSKVHKLTPFVSSQSHYNLFERQIEQELVPFCKAYNISIIPWFPLAGGFLTGKYRRGVPLPEGTRISRSPEIYKHLLTEQNFNILEKLETFAIDRGHSITELAFAWMLSHPWVSSVIAGVTRVEQLKANVAAAGWRLTSTEMAEIDRIEGHVYRHM